MFFPSQHGGCTNTRSMFLPSLTTPFFSPSPLASPRYGREMIDNTAAFVKKHYDGETVYGDTDSVFVRFPGADLAKTYELARECEEKINGDDGPFVKPNYLEYEKIFAPFYLLSKKRYAGLKYETLGQGTPKLATTGLELVRRDNAQLLPKLQRAFLEHLVVQGDADAALRSVHSTVRQLVAGEVDIKDFIISKKYAKTTYKTPQIHVQLNSRIARRSPGEEYVIGDRIPYVVIKDGGKPLYERGEDPKYAKTHNLPLDVDYYFSKQIEQPMVRLIAPLVGARACDNFFQRALKQNQQYVFVNKSPVITIYLSSTI